MVSKTNALALRRAAKAGVSAFVFAVTPLGGWRSAFCKTIAKDSAYIVEEMESPASSSDVDVLATLEVHMQQTDHRAVR